MSSKESVNRKWKTEDRMNLEAHRMSQRLKDGSNEIMLNIGTITNKNGM